MRLYSPKEENRNTHSFRSHPPEQGLREGLETIRITWMPCALSGLLSSLGFWNFLRKSQNYLIGAHDATIWVPLDSRRRTLMHHAYVLMCL